MRVLESIKTNFSSYGAGRSTQGDIEIFVIFLKAVKMCTFVKLVLSSSEQNNFVASCFPVLYHIQLHRLVLVLLLTEIFKSIFFLALFTSFFVFFYNALSVSHHFKLKANCLANN